jgi:hypothetical protein
LVYELVNIESKVSDIIGLIELKQLKESDAGKFKEAILTECQRIKMAFKQEVIAVEEERILKRYFSFHQQGILELINCCAGTQLKKAANTKAGLLLNELVNILTNLLHFIQDHFPRYFDLNGNLPESRVNVIRRELENHAEVIFERFKNTSLDPALLNLVLNNIRYWQSASTLSFRIVQNLNDLKVSLLKLDFCVDDPDLLKQDFCKTLIQNNFNPKEFYEYYVSLVNKSLTKCETLSDRIDQLAYYYKICNQMSGVSQLPLNVDAPAIQAQLSEWITQELDYLKQKQQLHITTPSKGDNLINDFKLNFDLSVSHLAYLFKSFTETGVIQNKNTSELIRFLTKFVKTKKSEAVSYESFRIKYYNAESGTKDAVKKTLQSLINYMNKN